MSAARERAPLWIRPAFSWRLAGLVAATHGSAGLVVLTLILMPADASPVRALALLLAPLVGGSLAWQVWTRVLARAPWSLRAAVWNPDGTWWLERRHRPGVLARLSPATFVSPALIVLVFDQGWPTRYALPLFGDALDADLARRLRQRLRREGGHVVSAGSAG